MDGKIAYFDNAATTFPKPECVYAFADAFYRDCGGSIGRGGNSLAVAAGEIARQAKVNMRRLYNAPNREIVFTASATDALNRILLGLDIEEGCNIYVSPFEHNAVTRPINHIGKSRGAQIRLLPFDKTTLVLNKEALENTFATEKPSIVAITHASNVCGAVLPVQEICSMAKHFGATTIVDMSQTAGLLDLDLEKPDIDFAVFAGHKTLYAPFGIGGFICRRGAKLKPVLFGGNGINSIEQDMPDDIVQMEEIGSQNVYAIAGLKASTDWILEQGLESLRKKESASGETLLTHLRSHRLVSIVANSMECERIGVVSALFDGYSPDEMEMILGRYGVAVRSGIQCAPYAHEFLETLPAGTVRFSVSALTTESDFEMLERALGAIDEG